MIRKLKMLRQIQEIEQEMVTIEVGKLIVHNFTLHMPFDETPINRVLSVNSLKLQECSVFALRFLFTFFLQKNKQIDEISIV